MRKGNEMGTVRQFTIDSDMEFQIEFSKIQYYRKYFQLTQNEPGLYEVEETTRIVCTVANDHMIQSIQPYLSL